MLSDQEPLGGLSYLFTCVPKAYKVYLIHFRNKLLYEFDCKRQNSVSVMVCSTRPQVILVTSMPLLMRTLELQLKIAFAPNCMLLSKPFSMLLSSFRAFL